jgi:hypothetical protein
MTKTCDSCGIRYMIMSEQAEDEGIDILYCPYCGELEKEEMDIESVGYGNTDWE